MRTRSVAILGMFVAMLAACGTGGPKTSHTVIMSDFSYTPSRLLVPAGEAITLRISNEGAVVHNFIVMEAGAELGSDFDPADEAKAYWSLELQPGASQTATFPAPAEPGEYLIVCSTAGHYIAGMTGTLEVVAP